jgi:predicted P-loop ATPase
MANTETVEQIKKRLAEQKKIEKDMINEEKRREKIQSNEEWLWGLKYDKNGDLVKSISNYIDLFEKCPDIGEFCYDLYTDQRIYRDLDGNDYEFSDSLYRKFYEWSENYISPCNMKLCETAMLTLSDQNTFNSAQQRLDNLIWDGVKRVETFFIDTLGVEDTPLVREMTKLWLVGAVQRIYEPGCKNENILILTGAQGCGKTQTLTWLSGELGFDNNINLSSSEQEIGQKLKMCWFVCFDELSSLSKREAAEYKNWLSIQTDTYRLPYGRLPEKSPRHNVYCGTTNEMTFLRDNTDQTERRMWVLKCNRTQKEWRESYYDTLTSELWEQIWSECVDIYKNTSNFCSYLPAAMYDEFMKQQRQYKEYNSDVAELLLEYLDKPYHLNENGHFEDQNDMIEQMKGAKTEYATETTLQYINHIPQSYVTKICTELLFQKKVDHNCMRNVLDNKWCVKKNKCRIGGQNLKFYIRGKWIDIERDIHKKEAKVYSHSVRHKDDVIECELPF